MTLPSGPLDIRTLIHDTNTILQAAQEQQIRRTKQKLAVQKRRRRLTTDVMEALDKQEES